MGAYQIYGDQIADMRRQGGTLRAIGETVGVSGERVRQILLQRYGGVEMLLLSEEGAAKAIGCYPSQLLGLRKKGITSPKRTKWFWLYDRDEMEKATLALQRSCLHCGKPLPLKKVGIYCPECSKESRRYPYPFMSEEGRKRANRASVRWQKEHPERYREICERAVESTKRKRGGRSVVLTERCLRV